MLRSGFSLNAPTMTIAPSVVGNTPVSGFSAQLRSTPRISCIVASWSCIESSAS